MMASAAEGGFTHYMEKVEGHKVRQRSDSFKDYFSQAKLFYDSMSEPEKRHILDAFHFELGKVEDKEIRQRMVYMMANVDRELASQIAMGIGVEGPADEAKIKEVAKDALPRARAKRSVDRSPTLSQENLKGSSIKGRKVAILIDEGFDYEAVVAVKDMLMQNNAKPQLISQFHGKIKSATGEELETDESHITTASVLYDAVFVPGGQKHADALKKQGDAIHFISEAYKHCKAVAATGEGIGLFEKAGIEWADFAGGNEVVEHLGVVTTRDHGRLAEFAEAFKSAIMAHRHWAREEHKVMMPA